MSDLAPGPSRGLSRETLARFSREWDKRVGAGPHTMMAERIGDREIIYIYDGEGLDLSGNNPYAMGLLCGFGEVITEDQMTDDLPKSSSSS